MMYRVVIWKIESVASQIGWVWGTERYSSQHGCASAPEGVGGWSADGTSSLRRMSWSVGASIPILTCSPRIFKMVMRIVRCFHRFCA